MLFGASTKGAKKKTPQATLEDTVDDAFFAPLLNEAEEEEIHLMKEVRVGVRVGLGAGLRSGDKVQNVVGAPACGAWEAGEGFGTFLRCLGSHPRLTTLRTCLESELPWSSKPPSPRWPC